MGRRGGVGVQHGRQLCRSRGGQAQGAVAESKSPVQLQQSKKLYSKFNLPPDAPVTPLLSSPRHPSRLPPPPHPLPFPICSPLSPALIPVIFSQPLIYFFPSHSCFTPLYYSPPITRLCIFFFLPPPHSPPPFPHGFILPSLYIRCG